MFLNTPVRLPINIESLEKHFEYSTKEFGHLVHDFPSEMVNVFDEDWTPELVQRQHQWNSSVDHFEYEDPETDIVRISTPNLMSLI